MSETRAERLSNSPISLFLSLSFSGAFIVGGTALGISRRSLSFRYDDSMLIWYDMVFPPITPPPPSPFAIIPRLITLPVSKRVCIIYEKKLAIRRHAQ